MKIKFMAVIIGLFFIIGCAEQQLEQQVVVPEQETQEMTKVPVEEKTPVQEIPEEEEPQEVEELPEEEITEEAEEPSWEEIPKEVSIASSSSYADRYKRYVVVGEVLNNIDERIRNVKIVCDFYDEEDSKVGSKFTFAENSIIEPRQKSPFRLTFSDTGISRYECGLQYSTTEGKLVGVFELLEKTGQLDSNGNYEIIGTVKNLGEEDRDDLKIIATFYGGNGEVVDVRTTFIELEDTRAGRTHKFYILIEDKNVAEKIDSFTLQLESR